MVGYSKYLNKIRDILGKLDGFYIFEVTDRLIFDLGVVMKEFCEYLNGQSMVDESDINFEIDNLVCRNKDQELRDMHYLYLYLSFDSINFDLKNCFIYDHIDKACSTFKERYYDKQIIRSEMQRLIFEMDEEGNYAPRIYIDNGQYKNVQNGLLDKFLIEYFYDKWGKLNAREKGIVNEIVDRYKVMAQQKRGSSTYWGWLPLMKLIESKIAPVVGGEDDDFYKNYFETCYGEYIVPYNGGWLKGQYTQYPDLIIQQMKRTLIYMCENQQLDDQQTFNYIYYDCLVFTYVHKQQESPIFWNWLIEFYTVNEKLGGFIVNWFLKQEVDDRKQILSDLFKREVTNIKRVEFITKNKLNYPCDLFIGLTHQLQEVGEVPSYIINFAIRWQRIKDGYMNHFRMRDGLIQQVMNTRMGLDYKYRREIQNEIVNIQSLDKFRGAIPVYEVDNLLDKTRFEVLEILENGLQKEYMAIVNGLIVKDQLDEHFDFEEEEDNDENEYDMDHYIICYIVATRLVQEGFDFETCFYKVIYERKVSKIINTANLLYYTRNYQMAYTLFKYALYQIEEQKIQTSQSPYFQSVYGQMINCLLQGGDIYEYEKDYKFYVRGNNYGGDYFIDAYFKNKDQMEEEKGKVYVSGVPCDKKIILSKNKQYKIPRYNKGSESFELVPVMGQVDRQDHNDLKLINKGVKIESLIKKQRNCSYSESHIYRLAVIDYWMTLGGDKNKALININWMLQNNKDSLQSEKFLQQYQLRLFLIDEKLMPFDQIKNIKPYFIKFVRDDYISQYDLFIIKDEISLDDVMEKNYNYQFIEVLSQYESVKNNGFKYKMLLQQFNPVRWAQMNPIDLQNPNPMYDENDFIRQVYSFKPLQFDHNLLILQSQDLSQSHKINIDKHKFIMTVLMKLYSDNLSGMVKKLLLFTFEDQLLHYNDPESIKAYKRYIVSNNLNEISNCLFVLSLLIPYEQNSKLNLSKIQTMIKYQWDTDFESQQFGKQILTQMYKDAFPRKQKAKVGEQINKL